MHYRHHADQTVANADVILSGAIQPDLNSDSYSYRARMLAAG
jgi:hypothetical protein